MQIISFLQQNAHPRVAERTPRVPENVTDQVSLVFSLKICGYLNTYFLETILSIFRYLTLLFQTLISLVNECSYCIIFFAYILIFRKTSLFVVLAKIWKTTYIFWVYVNTWIIFSYYTGIFIYELQIRKNMAEVLEKKVLLCR